MALKDAHIVIAGAGMAGLATALSLAHHSFTHITVYESASNLGFVGAGIQLAPNMARILDRFACWAPIEAEATDIRTTSIRQGSSDTELAHVELGYIRETYGYPHMVGHRASLAGSMYEACRKHPAIEFCFSHTLTSIESFAPPRATITPRNAAPFAIAPAVLLAADGIKSVTRSALLAALHHTAAIRDTSQAAYRIMLTREQCAHDPELLAFFDADRVTRWIGEARHIIAYPVAHKQIYNLSTVQPDSNFAAATNATYTTKGSKDTMLAVFADFAPVVRRMLALVPDGEVCEWKLRVHAPLPTWLKGQVALLGDACHPTLPHLAQGAAQAIEDGAVLGVVLSLCPDASAESIEKSLRVYESVRKERAETLVEIAAASGRELHLGEGKAKEERDAAFAKLKKGVGKVPDKWADADVQRQIYGFDCMKVAEEEFGRLFAEAEVE